MPKVDFLARMGEIVVNPISQVIGNGMFRGAVSANSQGLATFETEDFAATVRGDEAVFAGSIVASSAFVTGGIFYGLRRIDISARLQVIFPLIDYLNVQIQSLTGGADGVVAVLQQEVKALSTATDPEEIRKLRSNIEQLSMLIKNRANRIAVVSDYVRYFDTWDINPALQASLRNSDVPLEVLDEVPELRAMIQNPVLGVPPEVVESFKVMFGDSITGGEGLRRAGAASEIATSANALVNTLTQVQAGDFVMGDFPDVDEILERGIAIPDANEVAVVDDIVKGLNSGVEDFADGTKAMKQAIKTGKIVGLFAKANLLDLAWWIGSGAIDYALNFAGVPEEEQRIELGDSWFLNNIVEPLLDVSESAGTSFFDAYVLNPLLNFVFPEDLYAKLIEIATSDEYPTLAGVMYAIAGFLVEEVQINPLVPIQFGSDAPMDVDFALPVPRVEPLDLLFYITIGCVAKVVFNGWIVPAWKALTTTTGAIA